MSKMTFIKLDPSIIIGPKIQWAQLENMHLHQFSNNINDISASFERILKEIWDVQNIKCPQRIVVWLSLLIVLMCFSGISFWSQAFWPFPLCSLNFFSIYAACLSGLSVLYFWQNLLSLDLLSSRSIIKMQPWFKPEYLLREEGMRW